jgi:hypothetical protein
LGRATCSKNPSASFLTLMNNWTSNHENFPKNIVVTDEDKDDITGHQSTSAYLSLIVQPNDRMSLYKSE